MKRLLLIGLLSGLGYLLLFASGESPKTPKDDPFCPGPLCPPKPPEPEPRRPLFPRPWNTINYLPVGEIRLGGEVSPITGKEVQIDYPESEWIKNIGSRVDGAGMCVNSSVEMAFLWQNKEEFRGFRDYWARTEKGGSWPDRLEEHILRWENLKNLPKTFYVNYQGKDLDVLKMALKTGRLIGITYSGRDKVRYGGQIDHMVCLAHLDDREAAILDNNVSPELIWMTIDEFAKRWPMRTGQGWAVIPLYSPPPLPPVQRIKTYRPGKTPSDGAETDIPNGYAWEEITGYPSQRALMYLGKQLGVYKTFEDVYLPLNSKREFEAECKPPIAAPLLTGVFPSFAKGEHITISGVSINRDQLYSVLQQDAVPDDRWKYHLTVIGNENELARVKMDIDRSTELGKLHVNYYTPNHWAVKDMGFSTKGRPTIYLQHQGKVLHRQDEYKGLEDLVSAVRKASQSYNPDSDPDLRNWIPTDKDSLTMILLIATAGVAIWPSKRKS